MRHSTRQTVYKVVARRVVQSPAKPADSILVHGDVRRMLLNARANNEASRAFAVYVGQQLDITKFSTDPEAVKSSQ